METNINVKPFENNKQENLNSDPNSDPNSDTESDEYVDLSSNIIDETEHIFQFHISNENLLIKYIGKSSFAPDIIIQENFGPESNMSIYNCVYSHTELESAKEEFEFGLNSKSNINEAENTQEQIELSSLFFPIIKLIKKIKKEESNDFIISSIAVKLNETIEYEKQIGLWELYWVENIQSDEFVKTKKIEKNINSTNIIEKLIEYSVEK